MTLHDGLDVKFAHHDKCDDWWVNLPTNDNHGLNHRSINETSNQCRGGGVWEKYKWAFNDATDPSESERTGEEITIIKHLIFPMSDSALPSYVSISTSPAVSCSSFEKKKISLDLPLYAFLLFLIPALSMSCPLCVKNKGQCPAGDEEGCWGSAWYLGVIFPSPA